MLWDKNTGKPVHNAIVWQDTRTDRICDRARQGRWPGPVPPEDRPAAGDLLLGSEDQVALDNVEGLRAKAESGQVVFGNMDSWVVWNLTGGVNGGVHVTDPTNASRTMLMDLETLDWDDEILGIMGVPRAMLPEIKSSSMVYGNASRIARRAFRSPASSATSRRPSSDRPASRSARPRTPTAPATSCC